ncbi:aminomethyl-transferring glycine dehydrogenase [uncultured Paraglaciecola sp.]|uniref:aminomethyl-transferring glycine dehydrogenase n=1 Tax=uncultured Paraglaciecola sp. TaxID=1765024 RepID=UPI0025937492|nr:aminomethyl-transferring glycine dehydrogenase [uncultured Paraglaciecola sp.]
MSVTHSLSQLEQTQDFVRRHIGPSDAEMAAMLSDIGATSLDDLMQQTVPEGIRLAESLKVGEGETEANALAYLKNVASKNKVMRSFIGMGYYDTLTPNVILRNVLENPGWYTAYTPYQPEIAQGRLEALLNFQQVTIDLTGMELASASLLDEATAAAEAMGLAKRMSKNRKANSFYVADDVHPQTLDVVQTRADMFGFNIIVGPAAKASDNDIFGALLQYPGTSGAINDISEIIAAVQSNKGIVAVAADLLSLTLLTPPGELGADVVLGSAQRFGVPMGYGGPHAAFFATRDSYKRSLPGRIIGVSKDTRGRPALRMALQTREQHIRREKANSNICTAQVLLANMASFYAVYHGPVGLKTIASRVHRFADILAAGLQKSGFELVNNTWFDTLTVKVSANKDKILSAALASNLNLRSDLDGALGISIDETTSREDLQAVYQAFVGANVELDIDAFDKDIVANGSQSIPANLLRTSDFMTHPVFNSYHSETEMLRYIKSLEDKDLALNHSMISLGSCTMKLNATAEMLPVTWPEFGQLHPFAPIEQAQGYKQMMDELSEWLIDITGYDALSMQPNSGAQGEYAGLITIQKYHESRGEGHRNICLIPSSAHGTNPASAQMVSMKVVVVACDKDGNVDLADLRTKAAEVADNLSCAMITYPSTHGVYEETIKEMCDIVHEFGGQVYMDGANMNAQVGVTSPGFIGSDVSHLNLHKTFCIPHGGGGPGMGPIGVKAHLAPFLPNHKVIGVENAGDGRVREHGAVSAAPWGSASILPISYMYIKMMGSAGLKKATEVAMLNANYVADKLSAHYQVLYRGRNNRVAHECIIDLRPLKESSGVTEMDVAKRLNDYGFHAPTMSFPVAGTLMIEPTESEAKAELDRFIEAMVNIRYEIAKVETGEWDAIDNPLHNAPHTLDDICDSEWTRSYDRQLAAYPVEAVKRNKFWPSVNRIDDVYGDRNLFCECPSIESYQD